nr:Phage-related lysozyme (muraminidase) (COG3772) [uncultured Mediterranean phage uvMED]
MTEQGIHLNLLNQLRRHEGLRLKPYHCSENFLSLGYGRNLETNGISEAEAEFMLSNDLIACERELKDEGWYNQLDETRRAVVLNMAFNLGKPKLMQFKKFIGALSDDDYETASKEMITGSDGVSESKWASQVGKRAYELAEQMRTGQWQDV